MNDQEYARTDVCHVTAAVVGISRSRWDSIPAQRATMEEATALMRDSRYDVLPIEEGEAINDYFCTSAWGNYSKVERRTLEPEDMIPLDTHIEGVIQRFAERDRRFYFLGERADSSVPSQVTGLISVVNLNSRAVKVHLYGLMSELEIILGEIALDSIPDDDELIEFASQYGRPKKVAEAKKFFLADHSNSMDVRFVEYLYLPDLIKVAMGLGVHGNIRYSPEKFEDDLESLVALRNRVSHANHALMRDAESANWLWQRINSLTRLLSATSNIVQAASYSRR
jgi:hypothetical protein